MEELEQEESQIVTQLRKQCDSRGREVDPVNSARLLHRLGLVYQAKSPDKICLLQSAALYNAAIVRNPENTNEIERDLKSLCSHILQLSNSKENGADLISIAKEMFEKVKQMRLNAVLRIEKLDLHDLEGKEYEEQKIAFIQSIQNQIADEYGEIMKQISDNCIEILGEPPCPYSHVGLGSLAHREVTPFSDFESVIVLAEGIQQDDNFQSILEYFRWFTVIFQTVILNFGETIVPTVAIPSLNDTLTDKGDWFYDVHTPRGICFDGLMPHASKTPLGRQQETKNKPWKTELIKPISMMLSYLSIENDIKNGYHLADILATTCYVSGDKGLYDDFQLQSRQYLKRNTDALWKKQLINQIKEDLDSFAVFSNLHTAHANRNINTKRMIYRSSTIFISTLGKLHKLDSLSCFEIINEMEEKGIVTTEAAHNLRYAVAVGCEVRLSVYMKKSSQSESVSLLPKEATTNEEPSRDLGLEAIVSVDDISNYFKITFCIQRIMQRGVKEKYEDSMRNVGKDVEVGIAYYLLQYEKALQHGKDLRESYQSNPEQIERVAACYSFIKDCLFHLKRYEEALQESEDELILRSKMADKNNMDIANCKRAIGKCLFQLNRFFESANNHEEELKILKNVHHLQVPNNGISECCHNIAFAYFKNGNFPKALEWFLEEKKAHESTIISGKHNKSLFECLMNIAGCHFKMEEYDAAIHNYSEAKSEKAKVSKNEEEDEELAECSNKIGHCLNMMGNINEAVLKYQEELHILEVGQQTATKICKIHDCKANIAGCYFKLGKFLESLTYYYQILGTIDQNQYFLDHLGYIGSCLFELGKFDEALKYHENEYSGRIEIEKSNKLAVCLHHIGCDLLKLNRIEESVEKHKEEMKLLQELNPESPVSASASCFNKIATCFVASQNYEEALKYFKEELKVRKALDLSRQRQINCEHIADAMHNIASCLYKLGHEAEALEQLNQAMSYREQLSHEIS